MRVYLDNCCFNRPFDDQTQLRIRLEAEAKLGIQDLIRAKMVELAWSYVLDFENEAVPFEQRRLYVSQWKHYASLDTDETGAIVGKAEALIRIGLKSKDSLHLACAMALRYDYFLTTDDRLIKKAGGITEIKVTDPVTFIRKEFQP